MVLDTNVLVAAGFNPRSASAKIVGAVKEHQLRMVWNVATRREIERVVRQIPPLRSKSVAQLFRPENHVTATTHPERFDTISDLEDRKFAALAQAAGAVLISNDEHLLKGRDQLHVPVLTPREFWQGQPDPSEPPGDA
ncbi:MAG: PIN domain-containing protein [Gemmatimonadales bacterium]